MTSLEKPDNDLWRHPARVIGRMRLASRLWGLLAIWASYDLWSLEGLYGALGGAVLVEINLDLFIWSLKKADAETKPRTSLKGTLVKFYLLMALTALCCFLFIKFRLGQPLAFLAGLASFFFGLISVISGYVLYYRLRKNGQG